MERINEIVSTIYSLALSFAQEECEACSLLISQHASGHHCQDLTVNERIEYIERALYNCLSEELITVNEFHTVYPYLNVAAAFGPN